MGHAKIFIGKSWMVISLEPADGFTSFLAEKLRTIKAVNVNTSTWLCFLSEHISSRFRISPLAFSLACFGAQSAGGFSP
jgi:hypothetical protein